jgi:nitrite reductase/ring-hydroxylating ferredoxin subunit
MNPARPGAGAWLCALADIPDPGSKAFSFRQGEALFNAFVVRRGVNVIGYLDRCPHAGLPLSGAPDSYLTLEKDLILCAAHGALFRIESGMCIAGSCYGQALQPWPVQVVDGDVRTL